MTTKRTGRPPGRRPTKFYNERFEDYVSPEPNSGCWLWDGGGERQAGHCQIEFNGRWQYVHRFAFERYCGPIPPGLCVCHKCDVPCCVNPDHLFLGTRADNNTDMKQKGRQVKGIKHGLAKLTPEQVLAIRNSTGSVAKRYSVSRHTIWAIRKRKAWQHLSSE